MQYLICIFLVLKTVLLWSQDHDKTLILQLINDEALALTQESIVDVLKRYWILDANTNFIATYEDGTMTQLDSLSLLQVKGRIREMPLDIERNEYELHVCGDMAYIFYDQKLKNRKTNKITYSYAVRICERRDGVWKIHATSLHQFNRY
jgi:hypothetical protein